MTQPRRRSSDRLMAWRAILAIIVSIGAVVAGVVTAPTFIYNSFVQPKVAQQIYKTTKPIIKELTYLNCMFAVTLSDTLRKKADMMYEDILHSENLIDAARLKGDEKN